MLMFYISQPLWSAGTSRIYGLRLEQIAIQPFVQSGTFSAIAPARSLVDLQLRRNADVRLEFGHRVTWDMRRREFGLSGYQHGMSADLIALQKNRYWLRADGLSLDVGPFVAAIEYATGREAHVVGKPASGFFDGVLGELGVSAGAAVMVGDDVESDIGGALRAGLAGILVRTGKYREEQVRESGLQPTAVVDSIADVPKLLDR